MHQNASKAEAEAEKSAPDRSFSEGKKQPDLDLHLLFLRTSCATETRASRGSASDDTNSWVDDARSSDAAAGTYSYSTNDVGDDPHRESS